jgi:hypothetical protein
MANLIYVYAANKLPTIPDENHASLGVNELYQCRWSPTLMTDIFVGARYLRQVPSLTFIETMSSASDFIEAVKLFTAILPALTQVEDLDKQLLKKAAESIKRNHGRFLVTDFSEISAMSNKGIDKIKGQNLKYTKEAVSNATKLKYIASIRRFKKQVKLLKKHLIKTFRTGETIGLGGFIE